MIENTGGRWRLTHGQRPPAWVKQAGDPLGGCRLAWRLLPKGHPGGALRLVPSLPSAERVLEGSNWRLLVIVCGQRNRLTWSLHALSPVVAVADCRERSGRKKTCLQHFGGVSLAQQKVYV